MAGLVDEYYTRSFSSFSGADITATFAGVQIGTLQAISYAIQREKAPVYTLGKADPRAFSRGKRGIAGTLIFIMFDDHALFSAFEGNQGGKYMKFVKDVDEIGPNDFEATEEVQVPEDNPADMWDSWTVAPAYYVDQIPPFDVTVAGVNETGAAAYFRIWGLELLNEGYGVSVDDMVSEIQTTYVCRGVSRWTRAKDFNKKATRQGGGVVIAEG